MGQKVLERRITAYKALGHLHIVKKSFSHEECTEGIWRPTYRVRTQSERKPGQTLLVMPC